MSFSISLKFKNNVQILNLWHRYIIVNCYSVFLFEISLDHIQNLKTSVRYVMIFLNPVRTNISLLEMLVFFTPVNMHYSIFMQSARLFEDTIMQCDKCYIRKLILILCNCTCIGSQHQSSNSWVMTAVMHLLIFSECMYRNFLNP